jgi:hypothetical protein
MNVPIGLHRSLLNYLAGRWKHYNRVHLAGRLKPPSFVLDDSVQRLGRWDALSRTLGISLEHAASAPSIIVDETLKHEMAHQVVTELLEAPGAPPHGVLFGRACRMLGISDGPTAPRVVDPRAAKVLDRVQKLMSLSSSDNPHEAEAAIAAANRLLLQHNLVADQDVERADYAWRFVGPAVGRLPLERKLLASLLAEFFFVQCVWMSATVIGKGKQVRLLEISGRPENLELAEYTHDYLSRTLDTLWRRYKKQAGPSSSGRSDRNSYRSGVLMGFRERLRREKESAKEEGLIWLGDPALHEYLGTRHPNLGVLKGGRYRRTDAFYKGQAEGKKLKIRPGIGEGTSRGHALPPGKKP